MLKEVSHPPEIELYLLHKARCVAIAQRKLSSTLTAIFRTDAIATILAERGRPPVREALNEQDWAYLADMLNRKPVLSAIRKELEDNSQ